MIFAHKVMLGEYNKFLYCNFDAPELMLVNAGIILNVGSD